MSRMHSAFMAWIFVILATFINPTAQAQFCSGPNAHEGLTPAACGSRVPQGQDPRNYLCFQRGCASGDQDGDAIASINRSIANPDNRVTLEHLYDLNKTIIGFHCRVGHGDRRSAHNNRSEVLDPQTYADRNNCGPGQGEVEMYFIPGDIFILPKTAAPSPTMMVERLTARVLADTNFTFSDMLSYQEELQVQEQRTDATPIAREARLAFSDAIVQKVREAAAAELAGTQAGAQQNPVGQTDAIVVSSDEVVQLRAQLASYQAHSDNQRYLNMSLIALAMVLLVMLAYYWYQHRGLKLDLAQTRESISLAPTMLPQAPATNDDESVWKARYATLEKKFADLEKKFGELTSERDGLMKQLNDLIESITRLARTAIDKLRQKLADTPEGMLAQAEEAISGNETEQRTSLVGIAFPATSNGSAFERIFRSLFRMEPTEANLNMVHGIFKVHHRPEGFALGQPPAEAAKLTLVGNAPGEDRLMPSERNELALMAKFRGIVAASAGSGAYLNEEFIRGLIEKSTALEGVQQKLRVEETVTARLRRDHPKAEAIARANATALVEGKTGLHPVMPSIIPQAIVPSPAVPFEDQQTLMRSPASLGLLVPDDVSWRKRAIDLIKVIRAKSRALRLQIRELEGRVVDQALDIEQLEQRKENLTERIEAQDLTIGELRGQIGRQQVRIDDLETAAKDQAARVGSTAGSFRRQFDELEELIRKYALFLEEPGEGRKLTLEVFGDIEMLRATLQNKQLPKIEWVNALYDRLETYYIVLSEFVSLVPKKGQGGVTYLQPKVVGGNG